MIVSCSNWIKDLKDQPSSHVMLFRWTPRSFSAAWLCLAGEAPEIMDGDDMI